MGPRTEHVWQAASSSPVHVGGMAGTSREQPRASELLLGSKRFSRSRDVAQLLPAVLCLQNNESAKGYPEFADGGSLYKGYGGARVDSNT